MWVVCEAMEFTKAQHLAYVIYSEEDNNVLKGKGTMQGSGESKVFSITED